jgi:hypothetical protein
MYNIFKCLVLIAVPFLAHGQQDKRQVYSDGPKNLRTYIINLKHSRDSVIEKQARETQLRRFFGSTVYEMKSGQLFIVMARITDTAILGCRREAVAPKPFVEFASTKAIYFFGISRYLKLTLKH